MKHDATDSALWWIALVLGLLGIVGHIVTIPFISAYAFWLVVVGFAIFLLMAVLDETMHA